MVSVTFDHRLESGIQSLIRQGPTSPRRAKQPKPDLLETSTPGTLNSTILTLHLHPEMHDASRFCSEGTEVRGLGWKSTARLGDVVCLLSGAFGPLST